MEKQPSSWRGSNGGHEEKLPLRGGGLETERVPHAHAHAHAAEQQEARRGRYRRNCVRAALVLCLLTLPAGVLLLQRWRATSSSGMLFDVDLPKDDDDDQDVRDDMSDDLSPSAQIEYDRLLGGLLIEGFDERSCRSRYQFARYHRNAARVPSPYLIERLRRQEALQKKCGPGTKSYNNAAKQLMSTQSINSTTDCNYLLLTIHAGMGNRMLEITSAFLYALLTDRVLLVDRYKEIADTFCEPFPGTSWLIPSDFPLSYDEFTQSSPESYGNMLRNNVIGGNTYRSLASSRPPYVYLHLDGNYDFHDKLFYCEDDQQFLQGVPWLIMRTDMYFVPSLFLIPSFQDELSKLFPEKDTVFHHLGRYLLHPTNDIWYTHTTFGLYSTKEDAAYPYNLCQRPLEPFRKKHDEHDMTYKIFSCAKLEDTLLDQIISTREETIRTHWPAYHHYQAPEDFASIILDGRHLYYVNTLESAASAMETGAVAAENVARLVISRLPLGLRAGLSSFACEEEGSWRVDL